jgi:general stress protein 26
VSQASSSGTPFGGGVKQRDLVKMTAEEIDAFLHEWHTMSCATFNHDGTIHLVAMWYGFLDGCIALETKAKAQKVLNLRRDPRITCMIEEGETYEELRGVELVGTAEIIEEHERVFEIGASVVERLSGTPDVPNAESEALVEAIIRKRVAVQNTVDRTVSWDHRKLGRTAT